MLSPTKSKLATFDLFCNIACLISEPCPTTQLSPIIVFGLIKAPACISTFLPIITGPIIVTFAPIFVPSPIE